MSLIGGNMAQAEGLTGGLVNVVTGSSASGNEVSNFNNSLVDSTGGVGFMKV